MTGKEAYRVLGISPGSGKSEIKKRYRKLMLQVHPDVDAASRENYAYSAQDINAAYAVLMKELPDGGGDALHSGKGRAAKKKETAVWDAPVNVNAYREREVLQYAEDYDGTVLGNFCAAKGKYLWKTEEDFPLFLLSIYQCSRRILDEIDGELGRRDAPVIGNQIQKELAYLLAQQFIDSSALLKELAKQEASDRDGSETFYLAAMLELKNKAAWVKAGEMLYPAGVTGHRLFLKNQAGEKLGYLSFPDDRLYYIVIPLFEQKRAQVKIQAAEGQKEKGKRAGAGYRNLHLWIRLISADGGGLPENLNLQIERLLEVYREFR